jgi:hypothetical protein
MNHLTHLSAVSEGEPKLNLVSLGPGLIYHVGPEAKCTRPEAKQHHVI